MRRSPPRLLFVLHDELMGGATISLLRLVEPLSEHGWKPIFWVPQPGAAAEAIRSSGYASGGRWRPVATSVAGLRQPPGLSRRLAATPSYLAAYARFVRAANPTVIHANSLYSFAEGLAGRALGVPTLLHLFDMVPTSWKAEPVRRMVRHGFDESIAVSHACARSYATGGWQPAVVEDAVPIPREANPVRRNPKPFVVATVGVISRRKGSDLFVRAAEAMRRSRPDIEFRMIGAASEPLDREWASEVLQRARAAGIKHSEAADVAREMADWDALVLPSRRDPFPLVVMESMAAGLPVIASSVDGIPEQIGADSGVLVESENVSQLIEAIDRVSTMSYEDRTQLSFAARARAEEKFSIERQAMEMDTAYRSIAGRF